MKGSEVKVAQSCPTLCNPMDYTVHGILQARKPIGNFLKNCHYEEKHLKFCFPNPSLSEPASFLDNTTKVVMMGYLWQWGWRELELIGHQRRYGQGVWPTT